MRRLRLLMFLGVVLAVGATAQAKTKENSSTPNQKQEQNSTDKAKNNNDGHRKHWWSLPHFHHKKTEAKQQKTDPKHNADAKRQAEPTVKVEDPLIEANRKPKTSGMATAKASSHTKESSKTVRTSAASHKSSSHSRQVTKTAAQRKPVTKRVAASRRKTAHHTCSAEEASKGACQAAKSHTQKPVVRPAAAF
jgi:hypothetical protein